jgi:acetyltransferase-like isoleucine patch superfamily enzyme
MLIDFSIVFRLSFLFREPLTYLSRWFTCFRLQFRHPTLKINFPISLRCDDINALQLGENVCLSAFSEIVVLANSSHSEKSGKLVLGDRVYIGCHANIRAAGGEIVVGKNSLIAQGVSLVAVNHQIAPGKLYIDLGWDDQKTGIFIDENVWIGAGAIILPGVRIGKNSIVGAGSVVTKNIPPNQIWVGVPAKKHQDII